MKTEKITQPIEKTKKFLKEKIFTEQRTQLIKKIFTKFPEAFREIRTYMWQNKNNIYLRYIVKELMLYFFIAFMFFFLVFFVNQILLVIQEILSKRVPFIQVMKLMIYSLPFIIAQSAPFGTLVGFLMCIGRMMTDNEIMILRATGSSFLRIGIPAIVLGFLISLFSFFVNDYLLPAGTLKYNELSREIIFSNPTVEIESNSIKRTRNSILVIGDVTDKNISDIILFDTDSEGNERVIVAGDSKILNSKDKTVLMQMKMQNPSVVQFNNNKTTDFDYIAADSLTMNVFATSIGDFSSTGTNPREMTSLDLYRYMKGLKANPDVSSFYYNSYSVELNKKFSLPFGSIFFALLAFPLAIIFGKHNGQTIGMIIGILISVIYWVLFTMGQIFGIRNGLNGFICMWLPNIIIGLFGIFFIVMMIKR